MAKLTSLELYTFTMGFGKAKLEVVPFGANKARSLKLCMALSNLICQPILVLVTTYFQVSWIWRNNVFSHFDQVIWFLILLVFLFSLELFKHCYWFSTIISAACTFYVMYKFSWFCFPPCIKIFFNLIYSFCQIFISGMYSSPNFVCQDDCSAVLFVWNMAMVAFSVRYHTLLTMCREWCLPFKWKCPLHVYWTVLCDCACRCMYCSGICF